MTGRDPRDAMRCARCGATVEPNSTACWLCGASLEITAASVANPYTAPAVERVDPGGWSPLLFVALIVILVGLFMVTPGLGVFATFIVAPVLIRTYLVVRRREQAGKRVSGWHKVALFMTSFFVAYVILTVVLFAAFGAFCVACLAGAANQSEATLVLAFAAAGTVGLGIAVLMGYWVRRRYRRDISRP
ncbi:MAG: hypothetical protein AAGF97_04545 [Planctomycetota bacterium]